MGLRYASVRQPNVVVMAPALTETGQPQGFPAKPGSLSSPVALITFNEKAEGDLKYDRPIKCATRLSLVDSATVMNGGSENELKTVLTSTETLNKQQKDILGKNCEVLDQNTSKESDYSLLQIGGFMMNNSYPGAGDEDNMGFQKSGTNMDSCNYLKMDLFKGLGTNALSQGELGGGGDLGHNVDEIMQVIKNMESKGDIEENLDSTLQINDGTDIAGSLSTFDREFFNDVVMMNMCVDENLGDSSLAMVNRDTVIKDKIDETHERQFKIERKCEWLVRRLHKMQARAMGKQSCEEISGMLQYFSDILDDSTVSSSKSSTLYSALTSGKEDNKVLSEKAPRTTHRSTSNVSTFIKKLDQSSQQQALVMSQHLVPCKYFGSGSFENTSTAVSRQGHTTLSGSLVPKLNSEVRREIDTVSGQLHHQLKVVENGIDSDVTASSSGGESCDEFQVYNNPQQLNQTISKRASWRWAQDRTTIGSRWAWLQAQISDLEYRIRQNNDLHKQIRTAKGSVSLGGEDPPRLCDSVVVNGYHGALPGSNGKSVDDETVCESACRTRPLMRSSFRKRKLFQTAGLHLSSKKAAKPSTVPCGCSAPLPSCALCTGRPDPKQPFQDLDLLPLNERIALLDPAFHPVLSCPNDVSQSLHFDAVMKTPDWQMKFHRLQLKTSSALVRVLEPTEESPQPVESMPKQRPLVEPQQRRRYFRRNTAATLSEKIKRKLTKGKRPKMIGDQSKYTLEKLKTRRRFSSLEVPGMPGEERGLEPELEEEESDEATSPVVVLSATHPSPVPSPPPTPQCSKEAFRRKRENSYDIDNIVIPYSVAAATRLEKLQYKEILTPKWRVLPVEPIPKVETKNNNGIIRRLSQDNGEVEDLTEEMLVSRHDRCEVEEKKKFLSYLKLPNSMARPRGYRRADSRAESSGGNTPDPMSPAAPDCGGSPMTSPPATPQPVTTDSDCSSRRRTTSSRCVSPVDVVHDEVVPYEPRTFPLTDEVYEKMLKAMPPGHPFKAYPSAHHNYARDSECESRPTTPQSDSTESADTYVEDDPNDPEWTVNESTMERIPFKR